ncbi:3-methyl-2-oxobutanoate hydroxymethyltransferase [candidate division WOR-1 bacterium RIFOXYA12_FULL_52_29]|uniref:3-methyl-2-oxobutanoate hydroxymethyltransferase n=1 Tax=candidate division WOR-1 bacterium RIFOXYC12_FULL_54_18 TaxID=1802584 RepID=A0A1F4T4P9_UNCSA|nr:MAG: 3-methyl-2-oxobutanoate hydroxymethyltransferase [candidate division WOR-1 bacterium RIFOXYA2_FULL_51_19]OGC17103.1 MAG: 3-methyl-2-oxobutanoate hydroxymethyltransferase [candidate division WOR-1 bacterium RIFOXYA12_FULL_52_29]OGC25963.1 MAG: 3-methyl-2-oxobutanoate hydroxymethyltransferase [candidate division WOR-1 bacterium RIFOXYB2_FULL_45_9]OGC27520.1 MAG: 3-methyl-2-oxobutanoate hydroxymethyltransferase [candidate division WOR-1 bacterium RIFOXYC12_FULL_54_18]OGC29267.1 MAG: 3-meth
MAKLNALNIKQADHKLAMLTAYDFQFARLLDESDVDIVLVGDSLGNVALGYKNTIPVTMEEMEVHVRAVARGVKRALTVADMPFGSFQADPITAVANAIRLVKAGADAVKIEGAAHLSAVRKIIEAGIPVMGHLGFTPQSVKQLGYKVQGKERRSAAKILADARALEKAGCFAVVLEMVPEGLAAKTARSLKVPVIGIGAGKKVDGQVLVTSDLIGLYENPPSFVKKRADVAGAVRRAVGEFIKEVGK